MKHQEQSVRINVWARAVMSLEQLHRLCETFSPEDKRFRRDSLDFVWQYLLSIWLERWSTHTRNANEGAIPPLTIGYPNTELILDKRSNHIIPTRYVSHLIESRLRELTAYLNFWCANGNHDTHVATMLQNLREVVPQNINYEV